MESSTNTEVCIDLTDGLKRVGGNMTLYRRLMKLFVDGNHFENLNNELQNGNVEKAKEVAHALKGLSANLSFSKINAYTIALEAELKDGQDYSETLSGLRQAFAATLGKIEEITSLND